MKKFLLIFIFFFTLVFFPSSATAKNIKVISLESFSTQNPLPIYSVKTLDSLTINNQIFPPESIISGQVIRVGSPKRGKLDGYFEFIPENIIFNNVSYKIQNPTIIIKVTGYKPVDPQKIVFIAAKGTASYLLKGIGTGSDFVIGAIQAEKGQRIKSGIKRAYKESFLSYIEFGNELNVNPGDILTLQLKKIR